MKKIGVSIPWDYLSDRIVTKEAEVLKNTYGKAEIFLKFLKNIEVTHIELRHRKTGMPQNDMESVFQILSDFKFFITIHNDNPLQGNTWTINEVFPWLDSYNKVNLNAKNTIVITMHPFTGSESESKYREQTIDFLKRLKMILLFLIKNLKLLKIK